MIRLQLFLDCDGVLANFDMRAEEIFGMNPRAFERLYGSKAFWSKLYSTPNFFRDLPLMYDAKMLMNEVRHLNPIILTGTPRGNWAVVQKKAWAEEHFPGVKMITCESKDKSTYAKAGDILIDDWNKYRHIWIGMGGFWITHTCAQSSLDALWAHAPHLV